MGKLLSFEELKPKELLAEVKKSGIVYLPLGTLEWHERHLPFGLDAFVSHAICKELSKEIGGVVLPPFYFGTDREHHLSGKTFHGMDARAGRVLVGSVYFLKRELFLVLLRSVAKNVADQGFRKLVIVSAHSGTAQQDVLEVLVKEKIETLRVLAFPGRKFTGGIDHAGKIETSLMMAIRPELVNLKRLKKPYEALVGEDPVRAERALGIRQLREIVLQIKREILES